MLTAKQEQFVKSIIDGMNQADAYRSAYDTSRMADKTVHEKASRLMSDDKVRARLQELRDQMMTPSIMTAQERLEWLTKVINGEIGEQLLQIIDGEEVIVEAPTSLRNKITAMDTMNKMTGEYVQKVVAEMTYEDNLKKVVDKDEY